ncbi:MAG: type IV pilus twitching motility protein PilT [Myxococcales bacterium]|nr:type IV pilus twitching motility protein PilT [Myxococcales bacterium]
MSPSSHVSIPALLDFAVSQQASDLHLSAGEPPMLRVHGEMFRVDMPALSAEETHRLIFDVMNDAQRRTFQDKLEADFAFTLDDTRRFRVNVFAQNRGEGAVFRTIPHKIPRFDELGLPPVLRDLCDEEKGLVLVTGPTGSGKSTTLAAMIDYLNETMAGHILTLEDPIEFVHRPKRSLINQREVGAQTHSFGAALRSALREDPDVILVGELRDLETISLALTAAETGHLVFATVHTSSAAKTVDRLVDVFPPVQQAQVRTMVSESLLGVCTQMLLQKVGGGRAAALEILVGTPAVRNLIREGKTHQIPSAMQVGSKAGMQTMEAAVMDLVTRGVVSVEEAKKRVPDLAPLLERLPAHAVAR